MERMLLAAGLKNRASFDTINGWITLKKYSRPFQIVWDMVANYYQRDAEAGAAQPDILIALITETVRNEKHQNAFIDQVREAWGTDVSEVNVEQVVLEAKRTELADELALALTNGTKHDELLEQYTTIKDMTSLDDLAEEGTDELDVNDLESLMDEEADGIGRLVLYPTAINDRLGGGVQGGHHIVVYARPETGKTALCISIAAGFARQGASGLYFINEDRPQDIMLRMVSNLIGWTRARILENKQEAIQLATEAGLNNIRIISLAPGTPKQIEAYIKKYNPAWIVIDQLRNVAVRSDNRVNQLEMAATFGRNMAKKYEMVVVSVTQAGDSANNKEILDMGDVDFSNTGIPAQADVMIGMGVTPALEQQQVRMISLPKNKIGGDHSNFLVRIHPFLSRVTSI
jgi:KaiC/GvpD/RAD55 family RecA-like ATPase